MRNIFYWRLLFFFVGIMIVSIGIVFTMRASSIGVGAWDVLHIGLTDTFGLTVGTWSIILGSMILLIDSLITKRLPRIGTIMDMVLTGILIDLFNLIIPNVQSDSMQIVAYLVGLLLLSFGIGMYIIANLGIGPRDTLMMLISNRSSMSVAKTRTIIEVSAAVAGFALGGPVGVGTIIMAFFLGPLVQKAMTWNERLFYLATGIKQERYN